jgi:myo-inositol 2-dehydrogenase/D-chiro-inositol 1-dehydrogenase
MSNGKFETGITLCGFRGDSIVEQAVHNVDKIMWVMKDQPPISCVATGGLTVPSEGGNIYDHFAVNYLFADGERAFIENRQMEGRFDDNSDYILGADGSCTIGRGIAPHIDGKNSWQWTGQQYDRYQREHDVLFAAIRNNRPVNDGKHMTNSTLAALMGRMAAYTGQQLTWDQILNSQEKLFPEHLDWNGSLPVAPRAMPGSQGLSDSVAPIPGLFKEAAANADKWTRSFRLQDPFERCFRNLIGRRISKRLL